MNSWQRLSLLKHIWPAVGPELNKPCQIRATVVLWLGNESISKQVFCRLSDNACFHYASGALVATRATACRAWAPDAGEWAAPRCRVWARAGSTFGTGELRRTEIRRTRSTLWQPEFRPRASPRAATRQASQQASCVAKIKKRNEKVNFGK